VPLREVSGEREEIRRECFLRGVTGVGWKGRENGQGTRRGGSGKKKKKKKRGRGRKVMELCVSRNDKADKACKNKRGGKLAGHGKKGPETQKKKNSKGARGGGGGGGGGGQETR